ncbi:DNA-binding response regulator [Marinomonas sp. CT5]|uniref:response regulator transcription factor n=1 Tax=Marinomonas sp. CT5 TaxID=2066133 RepID=UPI0017D28DD5|nr:response regulator transcription factor [Marinomonas sp. CT5]NVK75682.1 response regulator transcription factor [Oceanospirillaceae bacterium]QUX96216.1 DNA-binding response regulator [Marinomonas sp. CT5]
MKLLLVEDHKDIAGVIFDYFEIKGYVLDYANNGLQGYELAKSENYDAIILDIMLPKMDGLLVSKSLREAGIDTPILMLTARDSKEDILAGFAHYTDDYLVKPFDLDILDSRLQALVRRRKGGVAVRLLTFDRMSLDMNTRILQREGHRYPLNPSQYTILKCLMQKAPDVVSKDEICDALWGDDEPDSKVLRSHIYQLRSLIDRPFEHAYLRTVSKVGYRLVAEGDE